MASVENFLMRLRDALAWRVRRALGDARADTLVEKIATSWRALLRKPVYIGITGSVGKTTTRDLLLAMLSTKGRSVGNHSSGVRLHIANALLKLRPADKFFVTELSGHERNEIDKCVALIRPSIGIVTVVGADHSSGSYTRDAIAHEKGKLVASLPSTGVAVLNADDELVLAMAARSRARVITYGISAQAELRAEDISSVWPDRLRMTLVHDTQRVSLQTQLCGSHWVTSVLAAIGGGLAVGLALEQCAQGIASVAPVTGRMQPVETADGVTFIRDEFKASLWTVDTCFDFMKSARAERKIIVFGEISDVGPHKGARIANVAKAAQRIASVTIFVGRWASSALKARDAKRKDALRAFTRVRDAAEYVNSITRAGDLVLLKGTSRQDHLFRIILARSNEIACWRDDCNYRRFCNECSERLQVSGVGGVVRGEPLSRTATSARSPVQSLGLGAQVIVGLGNPPAKYIGTPHNIGYEVVDRLANALDLNWVEAPEAWIARAMSSSGYPLCLVKIRTSVNQIGHGLKQLSENLSFGPEQCLLVHDDLDLPLGSIRTRMSGGAGGHRGVASILEAFQTDAFRRVKIGIGLQGSKHQGTNYVLAPFDVSSRAVIENVLPTAEARVLEVAGASFRPV